MKKAILATSLLIFAATVAYYFINGGKASNSYKEGKKKRTIKYIGERTHNSLHEIL